MAAEIWVALIAAVQAITLGFIGKISKDSAVTRKEVKNSHGTNLRDDIDRNHQQTTTQLSRIERDVAGTKKDIGRLDDRDLEHTRHHALMDQRMAQMRSDLADHLKWSQEYVESQKEKE